MLIFFGVMLCAIGGLTIILAVEKRKEILTKARQQEKEILSKVSQQRKEMLIKASQQVEEITAKGKYRVNLLNKADKEITARLKASRALIEEITDRGCLYAADIELVTEEDLLSSQSYQEDRKEVKANLKKLAINAIEGVKENYIIKFVSISAKSDMAGALLLTTVEMLCAKVTANNGHQASEKLAESIVATEALVKAIDSRAYVNKKFKSLLLKRLEIEINFKKAKQIAKEEQREIREQEREEKKVRQEAERFRKEAEKEERIKNEAIAELEAKMVDQSEAERAAFEAELNQLKTDLQSAHDRLERAKSRAQETKQGHVYIISNIGSFGDDILKIGMTRRLDPMDRVKELGDASVPFRFDVHAIIESEDAPKLEAELHKAFDSQRVNKINRRKEYFRVSLKDIENELNSLDVNALINKVPSADEYYQSLKLEAKNAA